MSKLRRTKIRYDEDIRYIFEFIRSQENSACKARDIPVPKNKKRGWVRHYLTRMENFKILTKKRDNNDGLYYWSISFDLLHENLDEEVK